jgi:hypothetical protein
METIHICVTGCSCSENNLFFFKLCRFAVLQPHQVDALPNPYRLHYNLLLRTTSTREVYGNLNPADLFIVHEGYNQPYFLSINNHVYEVDLNSVMDRLKLLVYSNDRNMKYWPIVKVRMPSFRKGVKRNHKFCAILLYAVQKYGFWVMLPNKTAYMFKVTFLGSPIPVIVSSPTIHSPVQVCIRDLYSNVVMDRNLIQIIHDNM